MDSRLFSEHEDIQEAQPGHGAVRADVQRCGSHGWCVCDELIVPSPGTCCKT